MNILLSHLIYFVTIYLLLNGAFIMLSRHNLIKKLVGLSILQTSAYLLYIAPGKILGGTAPILTEAHFTYSNPLPHVLILTAIVVGVATMALGLALTVRIREAYGTIEEEEIIALDRIAFDTPDPDAFHLLSDDMPPPVRPGQA